MTVYTLNDLVKKVIEEKCPCEECICLVMCRHRKYMQLYQKCDFIKTYLLKCLHIKTVRSVELHKAKFLKFKEIIKPTKWFIVNDDEIEGFLIKSVNRKNPMGEDNLTGSDKLLQTLIRKRMRKDRCNCDGQSEV